MKKTLLYGFFLLLVLTLTPLVALERTAVADTAAQIPTDASAVATEAPETTDAAPTAAQEDIDVYISASGAVQTLSLRDYCIGVVAAEMPALYEPEALKAQAAASMNLARRAISYGEQPGLGGAVISTDPATHQAYCSTETLRERWGDNFSVYYEKIAAAVEAVEPYEIVFDDALCMTAFHALSPGNTENAENVWSSAVAYLTAVDSSFDSSAEGYETTKTVSAAELAAVLTGCGFTAQGEPAEWLGEEIHTASGTLLELPVGNITVSGAELRSLFGLRSAAVSVTYADGQFTLTVRGYGHGVGMSQYGAQQLALQGMRWEEIIAYYYTGVEIRQVAQ